MVPTDASTVDYRSVIASRVRDTSVDDINDTGCLLEDALVRDWLAVAADTLPFAVAFLSRRRGHLRSRVERGDGLGVRSGVPRDAHLTLEIS